MADWHVYRSGNLVPPHLPLDLEKMPAPAAGIFDSPYACPRLNVEWASFIIGRLEMLQDFEAWLGNEAEQTRASREIAKFLQALAPICENDCPECPECPEPPPTPTPQLRQNGNCIEWLNPNTGLWECQLLIEAPAYTVYEECDCEECEECEDYNDCEEC